MICIHNRPLKSGCIACDPIAFFEKKLAAALEKPDAELRMDVEGCRDAVQRELDRRAEEEEV